MKSASRLFLAAVAVSAASLAIAQTSELSVDKKTSTYSFKDSDGQTKSVKVDRAVVTGATKMIRTRAAKTLNPERIFGMDPISNKMDPSSSVTSITFEADFADQGVYSFCFTMEAMAAYPTTESKYVLVDAKTGRQIVGKSNFRNTSGLLAELNKQHQAEIDEAIREHKTRPAEEQLENFVEMFKNSEVTSSIFNHISISVEGMRFHHNYDFVHAIKALEPSGVYLVKWADMKKYIATSSPLRRLAP